MHTVVPVLIIGVLGAVVGWAGHRRSLSFWPITFAAAGVATVFWVGGTYLLFVFTAPSELGPPLLRPILLTYATAYVGALAAGLAVRAGRNRLASVEPSDSHQTHA